MSSTSGTNVGAILELVGFGLLTFIKNRETILSYMNSIFDTGERLYTDGGCIASNPSQIGIVWAYCLVDAEDNLIREDSGFVPFPGGTNNQAEMLAAVEGLESLPLGWSGTFISDSKTTIARLFEGAALKNLPLEYVNRARTALERLGIVVPIHNDGHPTKAQLKTGIGKRGNPVSKWNKRCDLLCNQAKEPYINTLDYDRETIIQEVIQEKAEK